MAAHIAMPTTGIGTPTIAAPKTTRGASWTQSRGSWSRFCISTRLSPALPDSTDRAAR